MAAFWQDVRYGLRILAKNPGFAAIAILTLALGIGVNTALFSIVNGVLIKPLPYPRPEELVNVYWTTPLDPSYPLSYLDFLDTKQQNRAFTQMAAYRWQDFSLLGLGDAERVEGEEVSSDFFPLLSVKPILGRAFSPEENRLGAAPTVVIGDALWKRKFNSSPKIVGRTINLSGKSYTIVGVIPAHLPYFDPLVVEVFVPIDLDSDPVFRDRKVHMGTNAFARLKTGTTLTQAQTEMNLISRRLAATNPHEDASAGIRIVPLKEDTVRDIRGTLVILMGAVGFVLLIACANVANLLLARSTARSREFAIRRAMGAQTLRLVRQLLTESVLLSVAGGLAGILLARWGMKAVLLAMPAVLPRSGEIGLDASVFLFTAGVSMLTGILFGLAPASNVFRAGLSEELKSAGRGLSGVRHRAQSVFVIVELALSIVLLAGAGLMIRSIAEMWKLDPGFNPHRVLRFTILFSEAERASVVTERRIFREVTTSFEAVPGIVAASGHGGALPGDGASSMPFWIEGKPKPAAESEMSEGVWYAAQPGFLKAMGIPLLRGRFFSPDDTERSPSVVVIDENFAREFFPNEDPIGKDINTELMGPLRSQIVGIVGHTKQSGLSDREGPDREGQFYFAIGQLPDKIVQLFTGFGFVARTEGPPLAVIGAVRDASRRFDAGQVLYDFNTMDKVVADSVANQRFTMILLSIFAGLALVLSAVGVYGVISYLVSQRTREIGVRIALGAQERDVLRLVLGDGARLAFFGIMIGLAGSLALTRLLAKMLFGVRATDPITLAAVTLVLAVVALSACYIPARRAMRVEPVVALRYE